MNQYEAMFLFDPTFGSSFENCEEEIKRLMERAGGEIVLCRKWDERRLAYRVKGRKRGVYVLSYLKVEPEKIGPLERDVKLSEVILRMLILRADDVTPEAMERAFEVWKEEPSGSDDNATAGADKPAAALPAAAEEAPVAAAAVAENSDATAESSDETTPSTE